MKMDFFKWFPLNCNAPNTTCIMRKDGKLAFYLSMDSTRGTYKTNVEFAQFIVTELNKAFLRPKKGKGK